MGQMNALSALHGPMMQPGGGTTSAPLQGGVQHNQVMPNPIPVGGMGGGGGRMFGGGFDMAAFQQGMGDWRNALMDWRGLRPDHPQFAGMDQAARQAAQQAFRGQMQDYRQQRPMPFSYFGQPQQGIAVGEPNPAA
jgi:hypothetical protein